MLSELAVTDLGVIRQLSLVLPDGMVAVTGETGAGKTLVVEAIDLLMGGRADPSMVRHGADEAVVEGRFVVAGDEVVLRRVVPASGRSRAYVDGALATAGALSELGATLVDLHGQHDHQSLLAPAVQRDALDRFGGIDLEPLNRARQQLADVDRRLAELGGDERARAREIDLLRFQVDELSAAALERSRRGRAPGRRGGRAGRRPGPPGGGAGCAGRARCRRRAPWPGWPGPWPRSTVGDRSPRPWTGLRGLEADLVDVAGWVRARGESIEDDPVRLEAVQQRRRLLHELARKYGDSLARGDRVPAGGRPPGWPRWRIATAWPPSWTSVAAQALAARAEAERQVARPAVGPRPAWPRPPWPTWSSWPCPRPASRSRSTARPART